VMPKKAKWNPGPVLLQGACTTGDSERVKCALEKNHLPVDICTSTVVKYGEVKPGMVLTLAPERIPTQRFTAVVVGCEEGVVQLEWKEPAQNGPPPQVGEEAFPRDGEETKEWWDEGAGAVHALGGDEYGCTGLHYAASYGRLGVVQYLLSRKADPNRASSGDEGGGHTPLMCAAHNGHVTVVRALLEAGADPTFLNADFRCAADFARLAGHNRVANVLDGVTVPRLVSNSVHAAMTSADILWLKYALQDNKLTPDWMGEGEGLLVLALRTAIEGRPSTQEGLRLLDFVLSLKPPGINDAVAANEREQSHKVTPLMMAASKGRGDLVERLIKYGADATIANEAGKTALMLCAKDADQSLALLAHEEAKKAVAAHLEKKASIPKEEEERREWKRNLARLKQEVEITAQALSAPPATE